MTNKYNAIKTTVDGISFDSKAEARRYAELCLLERAGEISDLSLQPRFELQGAFTDSEGNKHQAIPYIADFYYLDANGHRIVEDVKGGKATQTAAFRIKWKWVIKKYHNRNYRFRIVEA